MTMRNYEICGLGLFNTTVFKSFKKNKKKKKTLVIILKVTSDIIIRCINITLRICTLKNNQLKNTCQMNLLLYFHVRKKTSIKIHIFDAILQEKQQIFSLLRYIDQVQRKTRDSSISS